jgi:hypothetical protein
MPCPSHPSWFYLPNNIWWEVHIMRLLIMRSPAFFILPRPSWAQISSSALCSQTPSACVPLWMWETKFDAYIKQHAKLLGYIF